VGFAKQIGDIGALITRILRAVFFTILILTGNTMAQSMRERIPELAILKTLGFSDVQRAPRSFWPSPGFCCSSGVGRDGRGVGMLPFLNQATGGRFPPLFVTAETWLLAAAMAAGLALAIGLPPAWRRTGLRIVDALAGHR
jgi:putative ABC transport system permease protein